MVRQLRGKIIVVFLIGSLFVATPTPKAWAIFGSTSSIINAWDTVRTSLQSAWQAAKQYNWIIQDLQSADRTLVAMEDMYYMVQAFSYLHDNGGILGAVNYMSQATSMVSGIASLGLSSYQSIAQSSMGGALGMSAMSPQDYSDYLGNLAQLGSVTGSLAQSANTLSMISNENSGVPFLEVVNGAQLGVQAALTTTSAIDNLHSYLAQRDQEKKLYEQATKIEKEQRFMSQQPQLLTVPCDNMAATVTVYTTDGGLEQNGTLCTTVGAPGLNVITSTGTGINQSIANYNQQVCTKSLPSIVASGQPAPNCYQPPPVPVWNGPNTGTGVTPSLGLTAPPASLSPPVLTFGGGMAP